MLATSTSQQDFADVCHIPAPQASNDSEFHGCNLWRVDVISARRVNASKRNGAPLSPKTFVSSQQAQQLKGPGQKDKQHQVTTEIGHTVEVEVWSSQKKRTDA